METVCRGIDFAVYTLAANPRRLIMCVWNSLALTLCLVGGLANHANAGHIPQLCCANQTSCDQTGFGGEASCEPVCYGCQPGCDDSCDRCCKDCWLRRHLRLHFLDSTCDMYPHYAYYPENHGSYYYRPYNWEHYAQDTPRMLGLGYAAPYAEDGFRELKPTAVITQPTVPPRRSKNSLPDLEDLLRK